MRCLPVAQYALSQECVCCRLAVSGRLGWSARWVLGRTLDARVTPVGIHWAGRKGRDWAASDPLDGRSRHGSIGAATGREEERPADVKGGILGALVFKAVGVLGVLILIGMAMVPTIGAKDTAALYGTTADVGGTSTGIVIGSVPQFFAKVGDGLALTKPPEPKEPAKAKAKS